MKLNEWRKEAGQRQADLARALGVHVLTVSCWERGTKRPAPTMIEKIVEMTGGAVQPNDFYTLPDLSAREAA